MRIRGGSFEVARLAFGDAAPGREARAVAPDLVAG